VFASASAFRQPRGDQLFLSPWRRHSFNKCLNVTREVLVANLSKMVGESSPAAFDLAPRFYQHALIWFDTVAPSEQFSGDSLRLGADVGGITAQARAIDTVFLALHVFTRTARSVALASTPSCLKLLANSDRQ